MNRPQLSIVLLSALLLIAVGTGCGGSTSGSDCIDSDGDGYGDGADCLGPDCDDTRNGVHLGAQETCNGFDDDCDGLTDEDVCPTCVDQDQDGYGVGADCLGPDCDDGQASVNPGAVETCNSIDDDCDNITDEDDVCSSCVDLDGDGRGVGCDDGPDCDDTDPACFAGACCQTVDAWLEIYVLDIWAQPLPETEAQLSITFGGSPVSQAGYPVVLAPLRDAGSYAVGLSAEEHEDLSFEVNFTGGGDLAAANLVSGAGAAGHGLSMSHEQRDMGDGLAGVHTVYTGLRHKWFSAQGRAARRGNLIDLLINGEQAWARVYADLLASSQQVNIGTWWWMSDFELVRPWATHAYLSDQERWANTIMGILERIPSHVRILVGEFWGEHDILDWLTSDDLLAAYAEAAGDGFEFMGQGNATYGVFLWELAPFTFGDRVREAFAETAGRSFDAEAEINSSIPPYTADLTDWPFVEIEVEIASWHQKFMTIDHQVAFVGGMNVKSTDWDSQDHIVFDHRRMNYDATVAEREEVMSKERDTDLGVRRDYMIRVEGPAAQDAADIFQRRWSQAMADGVEFAENSTDFVVQRNIPARASGQQVQVTATMPEPFWEHAIAETWFNAVAQAQSYIFIEDQYWRIPLLVDAIAERMRQVPALKLIVITKPVDEWLDPGCEWTHATHQALMDEFGPSRYRTYQLMAFDSVVTWGWDETESRYANIDTHSKMLIVDDGFMSIGSCNKNNRGIIYEGELNVAVLDASWVREQRRRIFANILPAGTPATDDVATWWQQFIDAATWNDAVYDRWEDEGWDIDNGDVGDNNPLPVDFTPERFVHSLGFRSVDDCFFEGVGPDMTR